jgi:general secretion pathway protein N
MKAVLRYLGIGAALSLLFLIALFPAARAYHYVATPLAKALPGLQLAGVDGSVWSGHVGMVVYRNASLGELHWQLSPLALLLGKARFDALLQSQDGYLQSQVSVPLAGGEVELADVEGQLPMSELAVMMSRLPVVLEGTLSLNLQRLALQANGRPLDAEGSVIWHQAAVSAPQALSFGDLQLDLQGEGEGRLLGKIRDRGGPLSLNGTLRLSPDGGYVLSGTVAAAKGASEQLTKALGWLGKPDLQGRYRLNYSGRM